MKRISNYIAVLVMTVLLLAGCAQSPAPIPDQALAQTSAQMSDQSPAQTGESQSTAGVLANETELVGSTGPKQFKVSDIPAYSGEAYAAVNGNVPYFETSDFTTESFETYSDLDSLGRCGTAYANVGTDLMPTEKRGSIGKVKPSGWQTIKYDFVDGKYLYNRCHLIGFQLTAENANEKNLITGTRYMNVDGMLLFENMVADYVKETKNHVLYRVTPVFQGNNLIADGVLMEAESVEDEGDGILFCVFVYNVQPGVTIDYATGSSQRSESAPQETAASEDGRTAGKKAESSAESKNESKSSTETTYIFNTNTHKFHYPSCSSVSQMNESNKQSFTGSRDEAIAQGYEPCGRCKP